MNLQNPQIDENLPQLILQASGKAEKSEVQDILVHASPLQDIAFIQQFANLQNLSLHHNKIVNIAPLSTLH